MIFGKSKFEYNLIFEFEYYYFIIKIANLIFLRFANKIYIFLGLIYWFAYANGHLEFGTF